MIDSGMPLISVIIPTYNRAHLLGRAIQSVLKQSFSAFELLIIDDHATDNTAQVVAQWDDPRIQYLRLAENRGSSAARNCGIRAAKAEFITFLDDDDELLPDALVALYQALRTAPDTVGYVIGGIIRVIDAPQGEVVDNLYWPQALSCQNREAIFLQFLRGMSFGTEFGATFRRSVFEKIGLFDEQLWAAVDRDLFIRLALHFDFLVIEKPLVRVHKHNAPQLTDPTLKRTASNDLILQKHRTALQRHPQLYSYLFYGLALSYYRHNARADARRNFWRATQRFPFYGKAWLFFLCYEVLHISPGAIRRRFWPRRTLAQSLLTKHR